MLTCYFTGQKNMDKCKLRVKDILKKCYKKENDEWINKIACTFDLKNFKNLWILKILILSLKNHGYPLPRNIIKRADSVQNINRCGFLTAFSSVDTMPSILLNNKLLRMFYSVMSFHHLLILQLCSTTFGCKMER